MEKLDKKTVDENNINITRQIEKKISTPIFVNLLIAILVMIYFCIMAVIYRNVLQAGVVNLVKGTTIVFLAISIVIMEFAYKKESKTLLIHTIETLVLATHSLTTMYIIRIYNFDFQTYILASSYLITIYYVLKAIVINTKARRNFLKSLSDIPEIVKQEEPTKKEAVKREKNQDKKEVKEND